MSLSQWGEVRFDFAGHELVGEVVDYEADGNVGCGPNGRLTVAVDGETYQVAESDAERVD